MKLKMQINKIKCIDNLVIDLPIQKGLYAITGQNGSGKSTISACASSVFFNVPMKEYFGNTDADASIRFELANSKRSWSKRGSAWVKNSSGPTMNIKGFFEGSLIFGNRFKDMNYDNIHRLDIIDQSRLVCADDFIRKNLGRILQGDENFYERLWLVSPNYEKFKGNIFYYEKNGKRISQFHMSTGENLLISILNSLYIRKKDRANINKPCLIFLDEIELALHPSSLKRLLYFLEDMAKTYNYAVYFSTHSIELISGIIPDNIFYLERHLDNTLEIINPCYPAYATKFLYDHSGYDKVILVEDDLAKEIIHRIIKDKQMMNNRLIHILPSGGWSNVLKLADDVIKNNLLGRRASISVILDKDIEEVSKKHIISNNYINNISIGYLPITSLEKFLRNNLVLTVNHKLFRLLNNYLFLQKSLTEIIDEYKKTKEFDWTKDYNGKLFYSRIDTELRKRNSDRKELLEMIVRFLFEEKDNNINVLVSFLKEQLK